MASVLIVLIILGCIAYLFLKATLVTSFAAVITAICAAVVAFAYFEPLANFFIGREMFATWAQTLSFMLLFILAFAILLTIAFLLTRRPADLGPLPERIGRVACGIFLGLIIAGCLTTALAMAPLSNKYPYPRFDRTNPNAGKPNKALFNADGFATGWFSMVSRGSFSGKRSFATVHADFLDQIFLNRHKVADGVPMFTSSEAIQIPAKKAVWPAPRDLKDSNARPLSSKTGHNLTIVRVGMKKNAMQYGGKFTFAQLRLVCKQKNNVKNPLAGKGKSIYPVGYLKTADQLQIKKLSDYIEMESLDFDGQVRWIDFAFYVPNDLQPVLVEFKQNNIARVPPPVTAEQAPPAVPFIQASECAKDFSELETVSSAKIYGVQLAAGTRFLDDLTLQISDPNQWKNLQTDRSIKPAQFEQDKISCVRAELKIKKQTQEQKKDSRSTWRDRRKELEGVAAMLKPLDGYKLLSLKCNNPSTGAAIKGTQLPVLVELDGLIHHPAGVIASGKFGEQTVYEVDYCSLTTEDTTDALIIAEDSSVAQPFPDTIWLTKQAESITEFYVLYLVKADRKAIIMEVQPADSQVAARFKKYTGFLIK